MNLWNFLTDWLDGELDSGTAETGSINPANGLPMLPGGGVDIEGNPYGCTHDSWPLDSVGGGDFMD